MTDSTFTVNVVVNGDEITADVPPRTLLSDFLRDHLGLTGTNVGCEHGYCGACTILIDGKTARSCLVLTPTIDGAVITTVEGLTESDQPLNPLQQAFQRNHALQCGFCTPGMLMTATELLETQPNLSTEDIRRAMAGNVCRCTGYVHIVDAIVELSGGGGT